MDFKNPTVQKVAIGIFLSIIIIALWYYQMYEPNKNTIEARKATLEELQLDLNKAKAKIRNIDKIIEERDSLYTRYKLLEHLMPTERDQPGFLDRLNQSAVNNGIYLVNIKPEASKERDFFVEDPYQLKLTTDYHKLGFFLSEVAGFPFTTTASKMDLKATKQANRSVSINLSLSTYHIDESQRLKEPKEIETKVK